MRRHILQTKEGLAAAAKGLVPYCPLERNHDVLAEQDCWACSVIASLYRIATEATDSGDPVVEAMLVLDETVEWRAR